jgi:hypothetical protein
MNLFPGVVSPKVKAKPALVTWYLPRLLCTSNPPSGVGMRNLRLSKKESPRILFQEADNYNIIAIT